VDGDHGRIDIRSAAVCAIAPVDVGVLAAASGIKVRREWRLKKDPHAETCVHIRYFISSLPPDDSAYLGRAVREHWSVENRNHHKRDDSVWQEDRHRHRRARVAQNLALTRNALLAIIPFDEKRNLPSLIAQYQQSPQLAINLIQHARPQI
jgi:predicted transposase YbfD/YdcC